MTKHSTSDATAHTRSVLRSAGWLDIRPSRDHGLFVVVTTIACFMPVQSDTWWQLRAGQDFWQTGSVVLEETYSHTAAGRFWINHEWLSEALFYALY